MKCPHCEKDISEALKKLMNTPMCKLTEDERSLAIKIAPGIVEWRSHKVSAPIDTPKPKAVISHWCDLYKAKYGASYDIDKKTAGIIAQKCKQWSFERFSVLFQCYLAIDEKFYREQRHPLTLFFRDIQKINVAAQTGKRPGSEKIDRLFQGD